MNNSPGFNDDIGQQEPSDDSVTNNRCNLIVNYLPQSLKELEFSQLFARIGTIKSCKLMFDRHTG